MDRARSLLLGRIVYASRMTKPKAEFLRLVCPICFEPVNIIKKKPNKYFAHYPKRDPIPCLLRIYGTPDRVVVNKNHPLMKPILNPDIFQDMLRICFGVPPLKEPGLSYRRTINFLVRKIHSAWKRNMRCVNTSDLPAPQYAFLKKWTSDGRIYQGYYADRPKNFPYLIPLYKNQPKKRHAATVLLLWSQLHQDDKQLEADLRYLLILSYRMFKNNIPKLDPKTPRRSKYQPVAGHLLLNALNILTAVPWLRTSSLHKRAESVKCAGCGKDLLDTPAIELTKCCVCGEPYCFECREKQKFRCKKCFKLLCPGCVPKHKCRVRYRKYVKRRKKKK